MTDGIIKHNCFICNKVYKTDVPVVDKRSSLLTFRLWAFGLSVMECLTRTVSHSCSALTCRFAVVPSEFWGDMLQTAGTQDASCPAAGGALLLRETGNIPLLSQLLKGVGFLRFLPSLLFFVFFFSPSFLPLSLASFLPPTVAYSGVPCLDGEQGSDTCTI